MRRALLSRFVPSLAFAAATAAHASFHLMQIEHAMGGVYGFTDEQAIQLRMRFSGQNLVIGTSLVAWDAAGENPVTVVTFPDNVANSEAGARIVVASSCWAYDDPEFPDFLMDNLIPASYLAAGRLTFESGGVVYWSLAWGDGAYTGSTTGELWNDADGDFGPPFALALRSDSNRALRFIGPADAMSTTNAADYEEPLSAAVFTNNAGESRTVGDSSCGVFRDGFETGDTSNWSATTP